MGKGNDGTLKEPGGIKQRAVGALVHEGMGELASQRLGHGKIRNVAIGDEKRGFRSEKPGDAVLQLAVERMIAGGFARRSDVEAEFIKTGVDSSENFGMRGEAEVIAAGEVDELASPMQNMRPVDLLKRFGEIADVR